MNIKKGVLSIEAALAVPIFILAILAVSFFIRVAEVQETIHYAISDTAAVMSHGAYILTKSGAIDKQNEIYQEALAIEAYALAPINSVSEGIASGISISPGFSQFDFQITGSNILEFAENFISQVGQGQSELNQFIDGVMTFVSEALSLADGFVTSAEGIIESYGPAGLVESANGFISGGIAKALVMTHIGDENLSRYGLKGDIDFSKTDFMLNGKDIVVIARYEIDIPFASGMIPPVSMTDQVRVKAFVGNQNYKTAYSREEAYDTDEEEDDVIVYVTDHGHRYHEQCTCRSISIQAYPVMYGSITGNISFCQTCSSSAEGLIPTSMLYSTLSDSKYHIDPECCRINRDPRAMTKTEAIAAGYTPCGICSGSD